MHNKLPTLVRLTMKTLESAGRQAYIVGGSVRDVISDKPVSDWDFTTDAAPDQIQEIFPESFYDNAFGTVGITVEELIAQLELKDYDYQKDGLKLTDVFEITTFRTEGSYSDNRRPDEVKWGKTILEDLERRDFTLNAMALRLSDDSYTLIDEYDGQEDLKNKLIRAVGDPNTRFREDALRMLRAVRLGSQHGFIIEPNTLNAITQNAQLLANISQERIRDELLKIVSAAFAADGLKILLSTGLLHFVLPEMEQTVAVDQAGHHTKDVWHHSIDAMQNCPSQDPIVRLATLLHDVGKPKAYRNTSGKITFYGHEVVGERIVKEIGLRLHLSNKDRERLRILVRHHMFTYDSDMTDAAIRRFIRRVKLENINDMMMLRIGDRVGGGSKQTSWRLRELQRRIGNVLYTPMQIKDMPISGHDLMQELKLPSGPQVGKILKKLFEEVLEDSGKNNREYLMQRAAQILEDIQEESIAS